MKKNINIYLQQDYNVFEVLDIKSRVAGVYL